MDAPQSTEVMVRVGFFVVVLGALMLVEARFPRRERRFSRRERWPPNLGISLLNQVLLRVLLPLSAIALAALGVAHGWGLLNRVAWPPWFEVAAAVLLLDLVIYAQHRAFHAVPVLWRLHRVHHADTDIDVTTGVRFHPLSVLLSGIIKLTAVLLIGPAMVAVLLFEVLLNATSLFNHCNLRLPGWLDERLRLLVVTPDMHRVHHSTRSAEMACNFGFNFPWWDRLFGSYLAQPAGGHRRMTVGLPILRDATETRFVRLLLQPFRETTESD